MAKNLTTEQRQAIIDLFNSGIGVNEVARRLKTSRKTVRRHVGKNRRSHADAVRIGQKLGTRKLTEEGRTKLSKKAKMLCQSYGKIWTKPEQIFKKILNDIGIGVKFSNDIKETLSLKDDINPTVYFQYPLQRYVCDFVDIDNKIVYCVNGDFWHANPILYSDKNLTKIQKHNVHHDKQRLRYLEKLGFTVCIVWESELKWNVELVKYKIQAARKTANPTLLHGVNTGFNSQAAYSDWSETVRSLWFKKPKEKRTVQIVCKFCSKQQYFSGNNKKYLNRKYCSTECRLSGQTKVSDRPPKEQLQKEVDEVGFVSVGRKYGVSDNAIRKWLRASTQK